MAVDNASGERVAVEHEDGPTEWEDRPFSPANEPPGRWERTAAQHPLAMSVVTGAALLTPFLVRTGAEGSWWGVAVPAVTWLVAFPLLNVWLWREGGGRRARYDRRLRLAAVR